MSESLKTHPHLAVQREQHKLQQDREYRIETKPTPYRAVAPDKDFRQFKETQVPQLSPEAAMHVWTSLLNNNRPTK